MSCPALLLVFAGVLVVETSEILVGVGDDSLWEVDDEAFKEADDDTFEYVDDDTPVEGGDEALVGVDGAPAEGGDEALVGVDGAPTEGGGEALVGVDGGAPTEGGDEALVLNGADTMVITRKHRKVAIARSRGPEFSNSVQLEKGFCQCIQDRLCVQEAQLESVQGKYNKQQPRKALRSEK